MFEIKHKETQKILYQVDASNLRGADLQGANLRGANLSRLDLRGANLKGADLRDVNLQLSDLRDADLRGANLRFAFLNHTNFVGADLRGADLQASFFLSVEHDMTTRWPTGFHPDEVGDDLEQHVKGVDTNEMFSFRQVTLSDLEQSKRKPERRWWQLRRK